MPIKFFISAYTQVTTHRSIYIDLHNYYKLKHQYKFRMTKAMQVTFSLALCRSDEYISLFSNVSPKLSVWAKNLAWEC